MKNVFLVLMLLSTSFLFAQGIVKGTITDSEMKTPLLGANVMVAGTSNGTTTDFDGNFSLNVADASGKIVISYVGFLKKEIQFTVANGKTFDLGEIALEADNSALDEIVITSFSLAIDRKTPVAVSTIRAKDIENRLGNQEFPEILKSTPGVYATKKGGGFGDAELRLRGFNSENIAVMINGVPVNGMENGRVYWSNWAGLSDVTRTMQVQRGLGASKVAVPSIGGTVNIVTKTTDAKEGGNFFATTGNDGYQKYGATVSTGKLENGFAITASGSKTTGKGFIDATSFEAYSYFLSVAKDFGDDHQLSFSAFGAPQTHGQRRNRESIQDFRRNESGLKFNRDWGYKNGQEYNINQNTYHKPQMSLNHYWRISEKTNLSTAVYASFGRGAGSRSSGVNKFDLGTDYRNGEFQPINFDKIVEENQALGALGSESVITEDINNHNWYGALSTLTTELTSDIDLLVGVDLRYYKGEHYRQVKDLLGGQFYNDDSNVNNPVNNAQVGDNVSFYNDGIVLRGGGFAQVEYSKDDLSAFVSVAASNTSYKRIDYFNYLDSDSERETDFVSFFGYSAKGGANYNIDNNHNVFANVGYFERAPFFNAIFLNYENDVNDEAENQKIFSAELGYGFRSENLRVNLNVYRTNWNDRTLTRSFENPDGTFGSANILGINALHQGVELDVDYKPFDKLNVRGMISIGDWTWQDDVTGVQVFDDEQQLVNTIDIYIEDLKVGDAAQTTFGLGLDYRVLERTTLRLDYNYYDQFYAEFEPNSRTSVDSNQAWEAPAYGLLDLGLTHGFKLGALDATIIGNINNILDTEYIADARDGAMSSAADASVWYGFGRTYTIGAKIKF